MPNPVQDLSGPSGGSALDTRLLYRDAVRGTTLTLTGHVLKLVLNLGTTLILARYVGREDFGIIAVALAVQTILVIVRDNGLASAIIQGRTITELHLNSVFWLGLAVSTLLAAVLGALAQPLAMFYARPELAGVIWCVALTVVIQLFSSVQDAQFRKAIQFHRIVIADLAAVAIASIAAIAAALLGLGLWSLVTRMVLGPVSYAALCWALSPWRPGWQFSWTAVRSLWSFGFYLFLTTLLGFGVLQLDSPVIGKLLGVTAAGVYFVAANLTVRPMQEIVLTGTQVMFPVFSALQDEVAMIRSGMLTATRGLAAMMFPLAAGLIAAAPELVRVVMGAAWTDAAPVMQVLALHALPICVNYPASHILAARGRTRLQFVLAAIRATAILAAIIIGCRWGVVGAAVAWTAARVVFETLVLWCAAREVRLPITEVVAAIARPAVAALVSFAAARGLAICWNQGNWGGHAALLAAELGLGLFVYVTIASVWFRDVFTPLLAPLGRRRPES